MEAARAAIPNPGKGNPAFRLTKDEEAKAMDEFEKSFATVTEEDLELEARLAQPVMNNPPVSDQGPAIEVKKTRDNINHLKDVAEIYHPASTHAELLEQVHLAKENGCDSIDATPSLVRQTFRRDFDHIEKVTGYGIYHNVRVYIDGHFDKNKGADKITMSELLEKR